MNSDAVLKARCRERGLRGLAVVCQLRLIGNRREGPAHRVLAVLRRDVRVALRTAILSHIGNFGAHVAVRRRVGESWIGQRRRRWPAAPQEPSTQGQAAQEEGHGSPPGGTVGAGACQVCSPPSAFPPFGAATVRERGSVPRSLTVAAPKTPSLSIQDIAQ